jgi:hypothetical protein
MAFRLALLLLLWGALGCCRLKGPFRTVGGQDFVAEKLGQIHDGMPAEEPVRLVVEPLEFTPLD